MSKIILFAMAAGGLGVLYAIVTALWINKQSSGTDRMREISDAVKEGASAFLSREYRTVAIVAVIVAIIIFVIPQLGMWAAIGFLIGTIGKRSRRIYRHDGYRPFKRSDCRSSQRRTAKSPYIGF